MGRFSLWGRRDPETIRPAEAQGHGLHPVTRRPHVIASRVVGEAAPKALFAVEHDEGADAALPPRVAGHVVERSALGFDLCEFNAGALVLLRVRMRISRERPVN